METSFVAKLAQLAGVKARANKNRLGICPRCFETSNPRSDGRIICTDCGFTYSPQKFTESADLVPSLPGFLFGNRGLCFYCGEPPDSTDYVVPVAFLSQGESWEHPGPRTFSCTDCNQIIKPKFFPCLIERAAYLAHTLRTRYQKELRLPEWQPAELEGMGHTLRSYIENRQNFRQLIERKLEWQDSAGFRGLWQEVCRFVREKYPDRPWLLHFITHNPYA